MDNPSLFGSLTVKKISNHKNELSAVFASIPSKFFHLRADISNFIISQNKLPINPYMNLDYNLLSAVPKRIIRTANNNLINFSEEMWIFSDNFGDLSDGVLFELILAVKNNKKIRFFKLPFFKEIKIDPINILKINDIKPHYGMGCLQKEPIVYPAHSKHYFYFRMNISKFVLEKGGVPVNPFMTFQYFMLDTVDRNAIRNGNNNLVRKSDEIWVFGPVSDGVLAEIRIAKKLKKPIRYFEIIKSRDIKEISKDQVRFEEDLDKFAKEL